MGKFFNLPKMVHHDFKWWIRRGPVRWINDIYWAIRYRTVNRLDRVNIETLSPGYYDIDHRMLHACFCLLTEFVEKEKGTDDIEDLKKCLETDTDPDWRFMLERQLRDHTEVRDLYNWWKNVYLKRKDPEYIGPKDYNSSPEFEKWSKSYADWELACSNEDEAQLIRLMKVREALWT